MGPRQFTIGDVVAVAGRSLAMLVVDIEAGGEGGVCVAWRCHNDPKLIREHWLRPSVLRLLAPSPLRV